MTEPTMWEKLAERFEGTEELTFEVGGRTLTYVNAQTVEERLDRVVGAANWSATYEVLNWTPVVVECRLTVQEGNGEPITKRNIGEAAGEDEAAKAAYSDAFKRAARAFGIGRYLGMKEPRQPRQETAQPEPRNASVQNPEPGKPSFLADVKEAWGYDPDQVVDILGVSLGRAKTLNREQQSRAWAKIKKTYEESGVPF